MVLHVFFIGSVGGGGRALVPQWEGQQHLHVLDKYDDIYQQ